jgi:hypothetical protein
MGGGRNTVLAAEDVGVGADTKTANDVKREGSVVVNKQGWLRRVLRIIVCFGSNSTETISCQFNLQGRFCWYQRNSDTHSV